MARSMGRGLLVAAEVALAAILIVGVGLLLRSFAHLQQVPAGYSAPHVLVASISVPSARYPDDASIRTFQQRMLAAARALPGVESAAFADAAPLVSQGWTGDYIVEGRPLGERGIEFHHRLVSPGYFETLGVPILRGRGFRESDDAGAPGVVLINEALARHEFRGQDPIGQRLQMEDKPDPKRPWLTIVGVVGNERREGLASPPWDEIFVSTRQDPEQTLFLLARTSFADPLRLAPTVEQVLHGIDRNLPLYETRTLEQITADATRRERFLLVLMGVFAAIALTLATIGIFGVVASSVAQRRQEIGLRIALGATRAEVLRVVAGQELALAAGGVAVGLLAAAAAGRLLRALLFEVSATDPLTFLTVAAFLAAVATAATYAPAWGALRIDPSRALRSE
jgi:putative ABC transport system permease protein